MRRRWTLGVLLMAISTGRSAAEEGGVKENRLAGERSPYLRQHRTNPVDWYPWGPEATERARREDRPLLVSVGYAACHWCHVMEHESFEDPETARLLNETFVPVKVDREERPDLDRVYMTAVQATTGRGGWPMTVLCLPDGRPFWGGTYLPRESLRELTRRVAAAWRTQRPALEAQAETIAAHVRDLASGRVEGPPAAATDAGLVEAAVGALASHFDPVRGGYGSRPKFPPHAELLFLLDRTRSPDDEPFRQVRRTLEAMDEGGVHDQVGGGFHRYSTDERWFLPHFEKMLYDNALLLQAYARAHAVGREPRFARAAARTLGWIRREMARPGGGYASSLDADTEGEEGLTYTWTVAEVRAALPPPDAELFVRTFGLLEDGNFREEATGRATGRNVPHLPRPLEEAAAQHGATVAELRARLDAILARLLAARARRPQPALDEKVIVGWNGLLLSGLAAAGSALGDPSALEDARRLAEFLLSRCRRPDGTLLRFPRDSGPEIPGFCEDHVHVLEGLLDLADATGEARWAEAAREVADRLLADFEDRESGGFWSAAPRVHEALFARSKEAWDSPIPSDQAAAARGLLRLSVRTRDDRHRAAADRTLAAYRPLMGHEGASRGVVGLFRALADRLALDEGAAGAPERGDAHVRQGVVSADLFLERGEAARGSRVRFAVRLAFDEGWHGNANPASDPDLVPTAVSVPEGSPVRLASVAYPAGRRTAAGGLPALDAYEGTVWIRGEIEVPTGVPAGPRRVALVLRVQACDAVSCRKPEDVRLEVPLRFADADGPPRHAAAFASR